MTTLRGCGLWAGLLLTALTVGSSTVEAASEDVQINNMMPAFLAIQDDVATVQRLDLRLRSFREQIIEPNRDIYSKVEFKDAITDEGVGRYLAEVGADLPQIRSLSANLEMRTREVLERFKKQFPRFDSRITIVYLPSLYKLDGQYTRILDHPMLLIGMDALARLRRSDADFSVLLAHELFHAHHERMNKSLYREAPMPLYARIWTEGLAAYASERVNPQASAPQIIGDLIAPIDRNPAPVAEMISASLNSVDPADQAKFLTYSAGVGVPRGSGYLVGYEIAKALSAQSTINDLTGLRGDRLRNMMRKQLEEMSAAHLASQAQPGSREPAMRTAESLPK